MSKEDPSADDVELGAYGRPSWLSDDDLDTGRESAAPFNPFATPASPEPPAPVPPPRIEPVLPPPPRPPHAALPSPPKVDQQEVEPPAVEQAPVEVLPIDVRFEPDVDAGPAPGSLVGLRLIASEHPVTRAPASPTEPSPLEPDGPLHTDSGRPDLADALPTSRRGSRRSPRWGGRRPYSDATEPADGTWWTPAMVLPQAPPAARPGLGAARSPAERVPSQGPWEVVDTGSSVEVASGRTSSSRWIAQAVVAVPVCLIIAYVSRSGFMIAVLFAALAVAVVNGAFAGGATQPFLRADAYGLRLRGMAFGHTSHVISWDDVAGFTATRGRRVLGARWPVPEAWYVVTRDGQQFQVCAVARQQSLNPYRALRKIMVGVAMFPMRLGRPSVPIDGVPGPDPFGHLPPPPDRPRRDGGNENVF